MKMVSNIFFDSCFVGLVASSLILQAYLMLAFVYFCSFSEINFFIFQI